MSRLILVAECREVIVRKAALEELEERARQEGYPKNVLIVSFVLNGCTEHIRVHVVAPTSL